MSGTQRRIVVGIDGSEPSKAALRWAIGQAKLTGASVDAVTAWRYPAAYGWSFGIEEIDVAGDAKRSLTQTLNESAGLASEVPVRPVVSEGPPAEVLIAAAKGADLIVVGSRGHGGFASAVLGSVSLACVLHAHCPVLVYRDAPGEPGEK